ncbi:hypothetical protein ACFU47_34505, partial [Streptomyces albogriseolus]
PRARDQPLRSTPAPTGDWSQRIEPPPIPERFTRFRRYALDGVFTQALQQIQAHADAAGDIDWLVQIDSTIVRAHQHAAGTGRKGGGTGGTNRTITPSADPEAG